MKVDDPSATYRGYRRQSLYALFRLFDDGLRDDSAIQPEGVEDLAIFNDTGNLIEVVQVKDHSAPLTASSFTPFFYERLVPFCDAGSKVIVRIATFGPVGVDLLGATSGDAAAKARVVKTVSKDRDVERRKADGTRETLVRPGLPVADAERIIERLTFDRVTEVALTEAILKSLAASVVGVGPREAFDFLMWWMLTSAESKRKIRRRDAIHILTHIGKFLAGRSAFHAEWHRSIVPLSDDSDISAAARSKLSSDFFRGGSVRFEHIRADVDIPRSTPLTRIHEAFVASSVTVVHSASGQGKTTLALRYLKEFAPASFRLQLKPAEGLEHARAMALAIREHTDALAVPTIVFIDVRPGDTHWVELVRELASQPLIRVLVTIREEDWQRANVSLADFFFTEIALDFDESEAKSIYQALCEQQLATIHIDFEEAWAQFGPRKSLLEFVYFVTQAETLTQRIRAQVRAFQDEVRTGRAHPNDEKLLRLVAVASAYEARLDLANTMTHCGIASPIGTLRRFEDEYFVRASGDGRLLDGFHAIRSAVLCDCLTDPSLFSWGTIAADALKLIEEADLEAFLLCAFSRRDDARPALATALDALDPLTWSGVCGVMRALMWLGLREYWLANRSVVDQAIAENPGGWFLMLEWDVAQVLGGSRNIFDELGAPWSAAAERSRSLRAQLTDRATVFARVGTWLRSRRHLPAQPIDARDWMALSEVLFWCGRLRVEPALPFRIDSDAISTATANLPLHRVGDLIRGFRETIPDAVRDWLTLQRQTSLERVRREAGIVTLDESDDAVVAHYLIDLDTEASRLRRQGHDSEATKASLHDLTIERVELLSQLIPGKQRYGAVGYGHRLSIMVLPFDDANKPGVLAENIHPILATRFNALSRGYSEYHLRATDWQMFFSLFATLREQVLRCFGALRSTIQTARREAVAQVFSQRATEWDACRRALSAGLLFPKAAVDEWGYVTESSHPAGSERSQERRVASALRFGPLRDAIGRLTTTLTNFMAQAIEGLIVVPALRAASTARERQQVRSRGERLGLSEKSLRLSVINGCDACVAIRQLHNTFGMVESLRKFRDGDLEARELRDYGATINAWTTFVFPAKRDQAHVSHDSEPLGWVLQSLRNRLRHNLQGLRRHQVVAKTVPHIVMWDGKPGLWIQADADHPIRAMNALTHIWDAIRQSFDTDTASPLRYCATSLNWEDIVVALTVKRRSLGRYAFRHFKAAAFREDGSLDEMQWALVPEEVASDIWEQTGIECWEMPGAMVSIDEFVASYAVLMQHVQHMADFNRIPETDEIGLSILQEYLGRESKRAEPMLQATYDTFAEVLQHSSGLGQLEQSPNLLGALQALIELKDALPPTAGQVDESKQPVLHRLSLTDVVEWRDRLSKGFELVGLARLYWAAHLLQCPEFVC